MKGHQDIAKQLNLTDEQKPKYDAIMKGAADKGRTLREDTSLTPEEKKAKAKAIREGNGHANERRFDAGTIRQVAGKVEKGAHNHMTGAPARMLPRRPIPHSRQIDFSSDG